MSRLGPLRIPVLRVCVGKGVVVQREEQSRQNQSRSVRGTYLDEGIYIITRIIW